MLNLQQSIFYIQKVPKKIESESLGPYNTLPLRRLPWNDNVKKFFILGR
jgi:hypothetical protein